MKLAPLSLNDNPIYYPTDYVLVPERGPSDPRWVEHQGLHRLVLLALEQMRGRGIGAEEVGLILDQYSGNGPAQPAAVIQCQGVFYASEMGEIGKAVERQRGRMIEAPNRAHPFCAAYVVSEVLP